MTDPLTPSPTIAEFAELEATDRNAWWRLSSGDHQNLYDAAREQIETLKADFTELFDEVCEQDRKIVALLDMVAEHTPDGFDYRAVLAEQFPTNPSPVS